MYKIKSITQSVLQLSAPTVVPPKIDLVNVKQSHSLFAFKGS
jgi:hypothetical protein